MKLDELTDYKWLGLLRVCKPKKNSKIGIPIMPWHHLAFIDNYVLVYIWNSRVIEAVYRLNDVKPFECVDIVDNYKPLKISDHLFDYDLTLLTKLMAKYPLPIASKSNECELSVSKISDLRELVSLKMEAFLEQKLTKSLTISEDLRILTFNDEPVVKEGVWMFEPQPMLRDNVLGNMTLATGRQQLYLDHAKLWVLENEIIPKYIADYQPIKVDETKKSKQTKKSESDVTS